VDAFKRFFELNGKPLNDKAFLNGFLTFDDGKELMRKIKRDNMKISAVFAYNDILAAGMIYEAQKVGIKIPQDISILAIDNMPLCTMVNPNITTVAQPQYEQGSKAAELLLSVIGNIDKNFEDSVLEPFIIERESFLDKKDLTIL
jgi:DNA-binding LacI/PurR family transcriptional regulator